MYFLIIFSHKVEGVITDIEFFGSEQEAIEAVERVAGEKRLAHEVLLWSFFDHIALRRWPKGYPKRPRVDYRPFPEVT